MFSKILHSFGFAFNGIILLIKTERNFIIHFSALIFVVCLGFYFDIQQTEWFAILGVSALVMSLEAVNTAIEKFCDLYSTEHDLRIKLIKDISASAVLIAVLFSIVIGIIVFSKYL